MAEIKLIRGGRKITLRKNRNAFGVRLRQGRATSEAVLESTLGQPRSDVTHVASDAPSRMEIFALRETDKLEETMDTMREAPAADVITHIYAIDDTPGGEVVPTGTIMPHKPSFHTVSSLKLLAFLLPRVEDRDQQQCCHRRDDHSHPHNRLGVLQLWKI